ncbi:hypothetical protein ACFW9L_20855 [Streptomyces sp. NPDC059517]|uniref:hypothetical protein n=1 Tax=Streptomyces sp. NPDC059517 TaxID=3346855 RepID=UPI003691F02F
MPMDPYAILRALVRAESLRNAPKTPPETGRTAPNPNLSPTPNPSPKVKPTPSSASASASSPASERQIPFRNRERD